MHAATGVAHQLDDGADGDGFGGDRDAGQAETAGDFPFVRDAVARQPVVLRLQPDGKTEGGGVLHGAQQRLGIDHRPVGLRKGDAAGLLQAGQFGQALALEAKGQGAERQDSRLADLGTAMDQAVSQFRLVERGVGIRRYDDAGHATGDGRGQFGLDGVQAGTEVDETRTHDATGGIDELIGSKTGRSLADAGHLAIGDIQRSTADDAVLRVDDAAVLNNDVHVQFPATMLMTAMRTAMPKVTWGRITACAPSATAE